MMFKLLTVSILVLGAVTATYLVARHRATVNSLPKAELVIRGGRLIDGTGRPPIEHAVIVIVDGKVQAVFREGDGVIPPSARVIDASGRTILPGLIDDHVHLIIGSGGSANSPLEYAPERVLRDLRADLYWGVTTVRSAGDMLDWILRLREHELNGTLTSPRLYVVGPMITAVDGHPARFLPPMIASEATRQVSNPQEVRETVEELAARKVDMIKLIYDGGSRWAHFPKLPLELLKVAIDEAHQKGLRVSVHTWNTSDLKDAVRAGADGVEHGATDPLDAEAIQLMLEHSTFYCPTLAVHLSHAESLKEVDDLLQRDDVRRTVNSTVREGLAKHDGYIFKMKEDAELNEYFQTVLQTSKQNTQLVYRSGIKIALGTDAGEPLVFHGLAVHTELRLMVESGIPPMQALVAATRNAAEYIGQGASLGTLEAGKIADILIVEGNPLEDINATNKVWQVIKGGNVIDREHLLD
ncbi:MAG TPA: amidohydrolase family protein [Pyrinomonadaceae bacterium]|nr:amidohydrolase family protein [Pyrinomonadaceae bacterium]